MFKKKKYSIWSTIFIVGRISPGYVLIKVSNSILTSLFPVLQTMVIASFTETVIEIFSGDKEYDRIFFPLFLIIGYVFLSNLLPIITALIVEEEYNKLDITLRKNMVCKRTRLEYKHVENNESWELINRVCIAPTRCLVNGFITLLSILNLSISTFSIIFIIMSSSLLAGALIVIVSIPFLWLSVKTGKQNYEMQIESQELQRRYKYLGDVVSNKEYVEERTLFNYSDYISKKYENLCEESYQIEKKLQIRSFFNLKRGSFITLFVGIIILGILLYPVIRGKMSVGLYVALVTAMFNLIQNMSWQLSEIMYTYAQTTEYMKDFSKFINMSEKKEADSLPNNNEDIEFQSLEFKDVSFSYPDTDIQVLRHCSFRLEKGKSYAFVGENGTGKTTIVKLLIGLYEDYEGTILINDVNIKDYPYNLLKKVISVVHQDFARYALTIKENICMGDVTKYDEELLEEVVEQIGIKEVVESMKDGMDTNLGKIKNGGVDISGGEWQRVALARLLYADSQINILDEPTAALDPIQESNVYELFRDVNKNKFTVYITHRLGAARVADEILVMSSGHVCERGTHEKLLEEDGLYKKMFMSQKTWYK